MTLPREVSLIWPSRWTPTKVIFLLSRYMVFFDVGFFLYCESLDDLRAVRRSESLTLSFMRQPTSMLAMLLRAAPLLGRLAGGFMLGQP